MKLEVGGAPDEADPEPYRDALATTALAVSGAAAFGAGINQFMGAEKAVQFFAGYVVELSLSVDNLFVFLLLFEYFKVKPRISDGDSLCTFCRPGGIGSELGSVTET